MYFFGYSNFEEDSVTNFFHFDEHTEERKELHNGFKRLNEEGLKEVCQQPRQIKSYCHNYNKDMVDLFDPEHIDSL